MSSTLRPSLHHRNKSSSHTAHDFWKHFQERPLDSIFRPRSVALIGASEKDGSVGRTILWNLLSSPFGGTIYPVNNKRSGGNVFGIRSFGRVQEIPERGIDLAIIAVPAGAVKAVSLARAKGEVIQNVYMFCKYLAHFHLQTSFARLCTSYAQTHHIR